MLADVTGDLKLIAVLKDAVLKDKDVFQLLASEWYNYVFYCYY